MNHLASNEELLCPIWGTPARRVLGYEKRDGTAVYSPRAGGNYFISRTAELILRNSSDELKVKVTHEIVDHNMINSIPEILSTTIEGLEKISATSAHDRANRLLRYLVKASKNLGHRFTNFNESLSSDDGAVSIMYKTTGKGAYPLFAHSDSIKEEEVLFLLEILIEEKLIKSEGSDLLDSIAVLPKGYDIFHKNLNEQQLNQAFVAMWFDQSMEEPYEMGIEAAVRETGYKPLRIDKKEHVNKIDDEIISEIKRSRFLIADFTSERDCPRGGVYFEAGYALALGKPVIWCCRSDLIDNVHFDTRQFNHIVWKKSEDLKQKLKNRIGAIIGDGPFSQ